MKMAFLVICPGSFQYDGERQRQKHGLGRREAAEREEREDKEKKKTSEQRETDRKKSFRRVEKGTSCPSPSSLSFLISLKERRSIECKCTVILTLAKVSRDVSTHAPFPAGHFGTGSTVKDRCSRRKWGHLDSE